MHGTSCLNWGSSDAGERRIADGECWKLDMRPWMRVEHRWQTRHAGRRAPP